MSDNPYTPEDIRKITDRAYEIWMAPDERRDELEVIDCLHDAMCALDLCLPPPGTYDVRLPKVGSVWLLGGWKVVVSVSTSVWVSLQALGNPAIGREYPTGLFLDRAEFLALDVGDLPDDGDHPNRPED